MATRTGYAEAALLEPWEYRRPVAEPGWIDVRSSKERAAVSQSNPFHEGHRWFRGSPLGLGNSSGEKAHGSIPPVCNKSGRLRGASSVLGKRVRIGRQYRWWWNSWWWNCWWWGNRCWWNC